MNLDLGFCSWDCQYCDNTAQDQALSFTLCEVSGVPYGYNSLTTGCLFKTGA